MSATPSAESPGSTAGIWSLMSANNFLLLDAWVYLQLIPNAVLLPLLVGTFLFSKNAKRHPTLINVCITWILSGIFSLLLFFAGEHKIPANKVNKGLCIVQTSLLYGVTPMWSVGVLMMILYLITSVRLRPNAFQPGQRTMALMLSAPYIVECSFAIPTVVMSVFHPEQVDRTKRQLYCSLGSVELSLARMIFTFIMCFIITVFEIRLAWILYRRSRGMRKAGLSSGIGFGLLIRVLVFGFFVFLGMIINLIPLVDSKSHIPDIYGACMGLVIFLIFGTQKDVLLTWCFWKSHKRFGRIQQPINVSIANLLDDDDDPPSKSSSGQDISLSTIPTSATSSRQVTTPSVERGENQSHQRRQQWHRGGKSEDMNVGSYFINATPPQIMNSMHNTASA